MIPDCVGAVLEGSIKFLKKDWKSGGESDEVVDRGGENHVFGE